MVSWPCMTEPARHHRYAYADYLALEEHSPVRHEFVDGEIYAMAGGTPEHAALAATVLRLIGNQLPSGCRAYTSDLRIRIVEADVTTYPDGAVICGRPRHDASDALAAINPIVIIEVTSNSTEAYDRTGKLDAYRHLESLREVVVVSHRQRSLECHARGTDGRWTQRSFGEHEVMDLPSIGARIAVDDVYRGADPP